LKIKKDGKSSRIKEKDFQEERAKEHPDGNRSHFGFVQ
jgi:hypothetical protein